ncbi:hypothetical protein DSO57_1003844 [Entomophthora muscae]|uniref:Uncharacterized protein n=1 Tax=Entomophthora muscae TaxID=34485 RepID=A0ACC2UVC1_9FUNG|nr:hypothetical protein DSO57_1003844 [Entomophthora muscae]
MLRKFKYYILENRIILYTDNMALSFILRKQQENERRVRWVMEMFEYLMDIKHIPRKKNVVADGFSRQGVHESCLVKVLAESYELKLYAVYHMLTTGEMDVELPVLKEKDITGS